MSKLALDTETFLKFIKISQPKQWERYEKIYGTASEKQVVERFCREVKMVGLLQVLRQGFTDRDVKFRAVYWKPETSINTTTQEQFSMELKCQFTGQSTANAIEQYQWFR